MALTADGSVCVVGLTSSSDFPTTDGAYDTTINDNPEAWYMEDGFVALLDLELTTLKHSTYIGGIGLDMLFDVALDAVGNIYVSGSTTSPDFPTSASAYCSQLSHTFDSVLAVFNPTLSTLVGGTYLASESVVPSVSVLDDGRVIMAGMCSILTITDDAADATFSGGTMDAYVAVFSSNLRALEYCTYFGGDDVDSVDHGLVRLDEDRVLVAGLTGSTNFPSTDGSTGRWDCFTSIWRT